MNNRGSGSSEAWAEKEVWMEAHGVLPPSATSTPHLRVSPHTLSTSSSGVSTTSSSGTNTSISSPPPSSLAFRDLPEPWELACARDRHGGERVRG